MEQGGGQIEEDRTWRRAFLGAERGCAQPGPQQGEEAAGLSEGQL